MLNSVLGALFKHTQKGNKKDKINVILITFYIFNILSAQVSRKNF
jgi:hypothetical protein